MGYWNNKIDRVKKLKKVAAEAIKYQNRKKIDELASAVNAFRTTAAYSQVNYNASNIPKVIFNLFGATVTFDNGQSYGVEDYVFAGVVPPVIDVNTPIVDEARRLAGTDNTTFDDYSKLLKKNRIDGVIDNDSAKLGGDFSKLSSILIISKGLFASEEFTDLEIAAIIGHEIGHIFSYFNAIVYTAYANLIARAAANEIAGTDDSRVQASILKSLERATGVTIENFETGLDTKNKDVVYLRLYNQMLVERTNLTGSTSISERNWERSADEFVTRLGGSEPLATGLYKIHEASPTLFREKGMVSLSTHIAIESAKASFMIMSPVIGPGAMVITMLGIALSYTSSDIYDPIEERFTTIRNGLVGELRFIEKANGANTDRIRKQILEDIASMDAILDNVKDKPTLLQIMFNFFLPSRRKNKNATDFHKDIEFFLNNELVVSASKLKMRT